MVDSKPAVWLVEGDDPVLIAERLNALTERLLDGTDPSMALEEHGGDELDWSLVADACRTPPFLAERRVVVVRDVGAYSAEDLAPIIEYIEEPTPTTELVLVAGGGRLSTKLTAAVKAHGRNENTKVAGREAKTWVRDRLRSAPVRLDAGAVSHLEAHLGEDVSRLGGLIDTLAAAYGPGSRLTVDDIEPYIGEAGSVVPWELTDAIDRGKNEVALPLLHRMLGAGDRHPLVVLAILHRHVANMLKVESADIATEAQAAAAMGIGKGRSTFPAKKALDAARRLGPGGVATAIGHVADAEADLKGRTDWPGELVLEVLVARLCSLSRRSARR